MTDTPELLDGRPVMTVGDFGRVLNGLLRVGFEDGVWIEGEVQGYKPPKPHLYFTLAEKNADGDAKLEIKIFANALRNVAAKLREQGIELKDGLKIRVLGRPDFYAPFGKLSLVASDIDTRFTLGELALEREALLRKLREGGFTEHNKRCQVPMVPLRLGVISSETAAGWADARKHLIESEIGFSVRFCDVRVQGAQAVPMIVKAIRALGSRDDIDLIMLMRGGGSKGDLAAFDDEAIAMAIANCPKPVFTGVGHEVDRSIADEMAHTACKTPTACADAVIEIVLDFLEMLDDFAHGVASRTQFAFERSRQRLHIAADRLHRVPRNQLDRERQRLTHVAERVRLLDPVTTMARGWSITRTESGETIRDATQLKPGDVVVTQFAQGSAKSTVSEVHT